MAFRASVRDQQAAGSHNPSAFLPGTLWAALLTVLIVGPWFAAGYLFGTDWPGPRRIDFPIELRSSYPATFTLAVASRLLSAEIAGKLLVVGSLYAAAVTAFRSLPVGGFWARAVASTVYVVNPFVYGRLHYGQLFLLAGYALLPWVAVRYRELLQLPSRRNALLVALALSGIAVFSTHLFLISGFLGAILLLAYIAASQAKKQYARSLVVALAVSVLVTLGATAYWVVPLLRGVGPEGSELIAFGSGDINAFAAVGDQHLGLVPNLLGLYGFWAENSNRFASMKIFIPAWPAVLVMILLICVIGLVAAFRQRTHQLGPWIAGLLGAGAIGFALEMGVSHPVTAGLVNWLDAHFVIYRGMRDAGKWAALLALVYAQLAGLGAGTIVGWLHKQVLGHPRYELAPSIAIGFLIALPLYYGNGLLYGAHGQVKPSQYPPGWYTADRKLASDSSPGRTLFLPWHEYMRYGFIQNQDSVVVTPAPSFFSVPILASTNLEVSGIAAPTNSDQEAISHLVIQGGTGQWASVLAAKDVKYILLAKEVDWQAYKYLAGQPGLVLVGDYGSIQLYRNTEVP
jgi:hypothetical protein